MSGAAARVASTGEIKQLGTKPTPDEVITEEDVKDTSKVAKLFVRILREIADLKRRWAPRRIDFYDLAVGNTGAVLRLQHNFNGRVAWWVIDHQISGAAGAYILQRSTATTANELVLLSYKDAVVSVRVEEVG